MRNLIPSAWATLAALMLSAPAGAAGFDEATGGDMSGDRFAPTLIVLGSGSNPVAGSFGRSPVPDVADLDYLRVDVPSGRQLARINLTHLNAGGSNSFLGIQAGTSFTVPPGSTDPSPLLGWAHIFSNQESQDLLPALGIHGGLPGGSYTLWINETDTSAAWSYGLDFQLAPVPEPAMAGMLAAGMALLAGAARRRGRKD